MKKILLTLICIVGFMNIYNAECTYNELKNLNTLATYIDYTYEYNESTGKFDLTFINVTDELYLVTDLRAYYPSSGTIKISGIDQGTTIKYEVYSSENAECVTQYLRVINITTPYFNTYFGTSSCSGYENIDECSSKFLNYELTAQLFNKRISEEKLRRQQKGENTEKQEVEDNPTTSIMDKVITYTQEYWIQVLLVIASSSITIIICSAIYRRVKHGF